MLVADVPVGMRLGKYRIGGRLGKGGMGIVYAGEDTRLRRAVAIKVLAEDVAHESEVLRRFLLEARAAAQLNHPNVVTIHDIGQRGSTYYIVMELVDGGSAQSRLQNHGALHWLEATRIVADICRGLAAAHAAGLIHRDVKPANILIAADGTAKLADFGLTKAPAIAPGGLTHAGTVVGTPQFMSPEHCTGDVLDARTDLYSLGVAYYTLAVGRPPYDGPDAALILYSHCSAPVPDPRAVVPTLPAACAQIIMRAMAKARSARFASADDMLHALLEVLQSAAPASTSLAPTGAAAEPTLPSHRSWRQLALIIGGLGVLLVCAGLLIGNAFFGVGPAAAPLAAAKADAELVLRARPNPVLGHKSAVKAVSLAGGCLVSASADGTVRVCDLASGELRRVLQPDRPGALDAVALSPDGKLVAAGGEAKVVSLLDAVSGRELDTLAVPARICSLAFAPSGKQLAVASESDLQLCDVETAKFGRRSHLLEKQYVVSSVAISGDGKRLAACTGAGAVHIWDASTLQRRVAKGVFPGRLTVVSLSADGSRVVFGTHNGILHLWEPDRGTPPTLWSDKEVSVAAAAFAPGGTLVFAGEWAGPLRVCDPAARKTTRVPTGVAGAVTSLGFAPDGRTLAAGCSDGSVRLWDVSAK